MLLDHSVLWVKKYSRKENGEKHIKIVAVDKAE
jgi:hypothetical protein